MARPSSSADHSSTSEQVSLPQINGEVEFSHIPTPRPSMPPPLVASRVASTVPSSRVISPAPELIQPVLPSQELWLPLQLPQNAELPVASSLAGSEGLPVHMPHAAGPESDFQFDFSMLTDPASQAIPDAHSMNRQSEQSFQSHSSSSQSSSGNIPEAPSPQKPRTRKQSSTSQGSNAASQTGPSRTRPRTRSTQLNEKSAGDGASESGNTSQPTQPRKKRTRKTTNDSREGGSATPPAKKRTRTSSGSARSRGSSVPALDPDADPGEDLDPTVVTMAAICDDTGQGRVSSKAAQIQDNHAAWKRSNRERRVRMRSLMEAKKYGRSEDVDEPNGPTPAADPSSSTTATPAVAATSGRQTPNSSGTPAPDAAPEGGFGFDYASSMATSRFNVQIRIGPNGETIVDEESLFVDRAEGHETDNYVHVEESDATKFVNSGTYSKKFRGTRWTAEETELFFAALSQFGENYELMSYVLPGRDRKACKAKFKTEDKKDPQRINFCLANRVPYDMQTLSRMTGKDFSGPVPVIRAKTPPNMEPTNPEAEGASSAPVRKQSRTPGPAEDTGAGAEAGLASGTSRTNSKKARKAGRGAGQDGVEVLGTIDGDWD
ncbi:hypothetical protein BC834DRAFT_839996 [Gloeopeniophorella convolvens]|nr:hypothetical protein BC834DRAFT_839996 [Gloeopeniophorella convolvens]